MVDEAYRGLSAAEVRERIVRGQVNRVRQSAWADYGDILRRNLFTLFNLLVLAPTIALFSVHEYQGAIAVSGMAATTTLLGLIQEIRAHRLLQKLVVLRVARVRVLREGTMQQVHPDDVVQDDVVMLRAGEPVVADGGVLEARSLEMDESLLTGEADPVPRRPGEMLLSGSFCVAGEGLYRALRVGSAAFAHQLSVQARAYRHVAIPFQRALDWLLHSLTAIAIVLSLLYVGLMFAYGFSRAELFLMVAATVTSLVPQGLLLTASLAFTLAAVRLSRRGAIVQELGAVEAMADVTVLCLDKTGTLTTNRLRLDHVMVLAESHSVEEIRRQLRFFAERSLDQENKTIAALREGLEEQPALDWDVSAAIPFHSQRRFSALIIRGGQANQVFVLGAVEALEASIEEISRPRLLDTWRAELMGGARLLLFARCELAADIGAVETAAESLLSTMSLSPLALVALRDEVREDARDTLLALLNEGVVPRVLSGDTPETVARICRTLPIPESAASGQELAESARPDELIDRTSIFGRLSPVQKVQIIERLQASGQRVAMVGDGVNDVLAIKKADLGVAMAQGSQAAQVVAGIVLKDNRFAVLPAALGEGRRVIATLVQLTQLFLVKNLALMILFVGTLVVLRLHFPILPQQVTLLNALTIGGPTLLILATHSYSTAGRGGGRLRGIATFVLTRGLLLGASGLVLLWISAYLRHDDREGQRTLLLTALITHGLGVVLQIGCRQSAGLQRWSLVLWVAVAAAVYFLVLSWPPTARFFVLRMPDAAQCALSVAMALGSLAVASVIEAVVKKSR